MFPLLALLMPLYLFGISFWMAWILPADVIIAFALGTFIGMIISEGLFQVFQGIFSFYYLQDNISEAKRTMKRYLAFTGLLLSILILIFIVFQDFRASYDLTTYTTIEYIVTICF
jgi:zinc transporter ZupT